MGKASFCNVQDLKGGIQCYVARDAVGEEQLQRILKFDIGDIIGVRGEGVQDKPAAVPFTLAVTLLSKEPAGAAGEFPQPDERDARYRQRYVDLIVNPEVEDTFVKRSNH